jgi:hypothetical protein
LQRPAKLSADFTYVWTTVGWLYVAAVIDLFSRRVVGWSMSAAMTAQLVTDALVMAIWRRGKRDALLHHSDRGSQYTSEQFQRLMADHGVVCSMSRSGNVWDWRSPVGPEHSFHLGHGYLDLVHEFGLVLPKVQARTQIPPPLSAGLLLMTSFSTAFVLLLREAIMRSNMLLLMS